MISYKKSWYLDKAGIVYNYIFLPKLEKAIVIRQAKKIGINISNLTDNNLFNFTINQTNPKIPEFNVNIYEDKRINKFIQKHKKYGKNLTFEMGQDFHLMIGQNNLKLTMQYNYLEKNQNTSYYPQCLTM